MTLKDWLVDFVANLQNLDCYRSHRRFDDCEFWGAETAFALADVEAMRYFGAIVGLSIGYVLKFQFDRRFVFPAEP